MAKSTLKFRSNASYRKFLAYEHIHKVGSGKPKKVVIAGKPHKVKH